MTKFENWSFGNEIIELFSKLQFSILDQKDKAKCFFRHLIKGFTLLLYCY